MTAPPPSRHDFVKPLPRLALAVGLVLVATLLWRLVSGDPAAALALDRKPAASAPVDSLEGTRRTGSDSGVLGASHRESLDGIDADRIAALDASDEALPLELLLHVRDSQTGDDLGRVAIYHETEFNPRRPHRSRGGVTIDPGFPHRPMGRVLPVHPGPDAQLDPALLDAASPVSLANLWDRGKLWVHVAGYSWESIDLGDAAGPRWLYLEPACSIDVRIASREDAERVTVHIQRAWIGDPDPTSILEFVVEDEVTALTGIASGGLRIIANATREDGTVLRSQIWHEITTAGTHQTVDLHLEALPRLQLSVRMLPRQFGQAEVQELELMSIDDKHDGDTRWALDELIASTHEGQLQWSTPEVSLPEGRYSARLLPGGQLRDFTLRRGKATQTIVLAVGDSSLCRVRCVDAETGAPVPARLLEYWVVGLGGIERNHMRWRSLQLKNGFVRLPYGVIHLRSGHSDYVGLSSECLIDAPQSDLTVRLKRAATLEVELRSAQGVVVPDFALLRKARLIGPQGYFLTSGSPTMTVGLDFLTLNFRVDADGPARLKLELTADLTPHPDDLDVVLRRGEVVQHTVRLIER